MLLRSGVDNSFTEERSDIHHHVEYGISAGTGLGGGFAGYGSDITAFMKAPPITIKTRIGIIDHW
jgi:hypothetical protein